MRRARRTAGRDRVVLILLGLVLLLAGAGVTAVKLGATGDRSLGDDVAAVLDQPWWPATAGIAGVVLIVLAVWWLLAHRPGEQVNRLALAGSSPTVRLQVQPSAAIEAANAGLAGSPDVRASRLRLVLRGGAVEVRGHVVVSTDADAPAAAAEVSRAVGHIGTALGIPTLRTRVHLMFTR